VLRLLLTLASQISNTANSDAFCSLNHQAANLALWIADGMVALPVRSEQGADVNPAACDAE
jgi:hypothetical protein